MARALIRYIKLRPSILTPEPRFEKIDNWEELGYEVANSRWRWATLHNATAKQTLAILSEPERFGIIQPQLMNASHVAISARLPCGEPNSVFGAIALWAQFWDANGEWKPEAADGAFYQMLAAGEPKFNWPMNVSEYSAIVYERSRLRNGGLGVIRAIEGAMLDALKSSDEYSTG